MEPTPAPDPQEIDSLFAELLHASDPLTQRPWLEYSRRGTGFWSSIMHFLSTRVGHRQTYAIEDGAVYDALVMRHAASSHIAMSAYWGQGFADIGYALLHQKTTARASSWVAAGVHSGERIAIVAPMGPEALYGLCAAWYLACPVALIPPYGRAFVTEGLKRAATDHVIGCWSHRDVLPRELQSQTLWLDRDPAAVSTTYRSVPFAPDAPALIVPFSTTLRTAAEQEQEFKAEEVSAGALLRRATVDGVLVHRLTPNARLASLALPSWQWQPGLLVSTLITGACYVQATLQDLEQKIDLLDQAALDRLGIGYRARDFFIHQGRVPPQHEWFRDPAEHDLQGGWTRLTALPDLAASTGYSVTMAPGYGASALFYPRGPARQAPMGLGLPSPGVQMKVLNPSSGMESTTPTGILGVVNPDDESTAAIGGLLVTRSAPIPMVSGSIPPIWGGRPFPAELTLEIVRTRLPLGATIVYNHQHACPVVLGFVGVDEPEPPSIEEIRTQVELELGPYAERFRVEIVRLTPRMKHTGEEEEVDSGWYAQQYNEGMLERLQREPILQAISRLRSELAKALT
ncbi:MAG: hypothetical protein AAF355_12740 [Myxococcota bacterium]